MRSNESSLDRAIRMNVGIALAALGLSGTIAGAAGVAAVALGLFVLGTGIVGVCPLYRALGWQTVRTRG
jgi:hypothetical protein